MKYLKRTFLLSTFIVIFLLLCNRLFPLPPQVFQIAFSKVYYDRNGQWLGAKLSSDDKWRFEGRLDTVSPYLVTALLEFEDKRFYDHIGIDPMAVFRAFTQNVKSGRIVSGASTLTMQVARLLDQNKHRGISGKLIQTFRALQLEWYLSKEEILELYFNLAPYGGNIEGVTAGSWFYFNKPPSKLNWTEAIVLAIAPKSPNEYRPDRFPVAAQKHCQRLAESLIQKGKIAEEDRWFLECTQPPGKLRDLPQFAKHLIDRLQTGSGRNSTLVLQGNSFEDPTWNHIQTTLDRDLQIRVEQTVAGYVRELKGQGIQHAAAIIIDNASGNVLAYVGSPDFDDKEHAGEVDGVRALRSPGSTLKPFIYAKALESGEYTPRTLLANVPVMYRGYHPQNFTPTELGIVRFDEALQQSLNLPAITLNTTLGPENDLLAFLLGAGVSTLPYNRGQYGQTLVLGGGEMRLDELTTLYTLLARRGILIPTQLVLRPEARGLRLRTSPKSQVSSLKPQSPRQLLTPESSYIISEILRKAPVPGLAGSARFFKTMPDVVWKTGTSSRQRDAWTVGYNPRYTVGVWVGNFLGNPIEDMTGRSVAAPLFFQIFRQLPEQDQVIWSSPSENVVEQKVCSLSGHLPTANCPSQTNTLWIAGITKPHFCQMHVQLLIDKTSGHRLSPGCIRQKDIPFSQIVQKPGILWPRETGGWLAQTGSAVIFPSFEEGCEPPELLQGLPPLLQRPLNGENYLIKNTSKVAFSVAVSNEVNRLNWFLDDERLTTTKPGEVYLWTPQVGEHKLVIVDDFGRVVRARFRVGEE
jgi:penicillin-binding protein 1C